MKETKTNVRFNPPPASITINDHPTNENRIKRPISPPPPGRKHRPYHSLILKSSFSTTKPFAIQRPMSKPNTTEKLDSTKYWNDYYSAPILDDNEKLPKPPSKIKLYSTNWKLKNPNPKSKQPPKPPPSISLNNNTKFVDDVDDNDKTTREQAFYGNPMMNYGMGMYPNMTGMPMGGMGMGGMGMGGMGMGYGMGGGMGMMGYGMPRYGGYSMYGGYGGYGGYPGMVDPMMGQYGAPPAANFVDDFPDAHRLEHAYRQSAPDAYGMGMGMMGGGMGINNMPGSQVMMYGRGMPYNSWYA